MAQQQEHSTAIPASEAPNGVRVISLDDVATRQDLYNDIVALLEDIASADGELASECDEVIARLGDIGDVVATDAEIRTALEIAQNILEKTFASVYQERSDAIYDRIEQVLETLPA